MCRTTTATPAIHPFEKAGLGKAPFRYVGMVYQEIAYGERVLGSVGGCLATTKPGGTCDYCGTYILDMFRIESADGQRFKVGCDCVRKVDAKLYDRVNVDAKAAKLEREKLRIAAAKAALPSARALAGKPHPIKWRAEQGDTMREWAAWLFQNAGHSGKLATARVVERAIAPTVED